MSEDAIAPPLVLPDLQQVLVQFCGVSGEAQSSLADWHPSTGTVEAMRRLVQMVGFLRSPDSGWEPALLHTPETLTPYVTEEATDLLEVLEESLDSSWSAATAQSSHTATPTQPFHLLEDLAPQLLWSIARTVPQAMRLLEGRTARVTLPELPQQTGVLRLSVAIVLHLPDQSYTWDLVTRQTPALLPPQSQISGPLEFEQPVVVESWLGAVRQRLEQTEKAFRSIWQPLAVRALLPGQDWQSGSMDVQVGFEFVPITQTTQFSSTETPLEAAVDLVPTLQLTESDWLDRYRAIEWQTELSQCLPYLSSVRALAEAAEPLATGEAIARLIQDALALTAEPLSCLRLLPLNEQQSDVALDRCLAHLSWLISRTDYRVMQLLGGIVCTLIEPGMSWRSGILRFRPVLCFQTEMGDWRLDLLRQHPLSPESVAVSGEGLVRSQALPFSHQPLPISQLSDQIGQHLQHSPLLKLWMEGTAATLQVETVEDTPGKVLLQLEFDFVEDKR